MTSSLFSLLLLSRYLGCIHIEWYGDIYICGWIMHKGIYCHFSKLTIYKIVHTAERHRFFLVGLRSFFLRRLHVLSDSEKLSVFLFSLASSLTTPPRRRRRDEAIFPQHQLPHVAVLNSEGENCGAGFFLRRIFLSLSRSLFVHCVYENGGTSRWGGGGGKITNICNPTGKSPELRDPDLQHWSYRVHGQDRWHRFRTWDSSQIAGAMFMSTIADWQDISQGIFES